MRLACLLVPELPLAARLRAEPELAGRPLAIASGPGGRAEVVAASPEARRASVRPGDTVARARAACAEFVVRGASPALERAARDALLDAALSATPRAETAPPGAGAFAAEAAVYADARGVARLFRSEAGFAGALAARAERLALPAAVAVASARGPAHLAARYLVLQAAEAERSQTLVVPPGEEAAFLAPLPLDLLGAGSELASALTRLGVRRVGELTALPERALVTRLGPEVRRLLALARGEEPAPPPPAAEAAQLTEATELEAPETRLEPFLFVLGGLLARLGARLEARQLSFGDLELALELEGGGRDARRVGVAAPTRDRRVLLRLAALSLESRPPAAPVLEITAATRGRAARPEQLDFFRPPGPAPAALGRTLAELEALCGPGRVGAPACAETHRPDAHALAPFAPGELAPEEREVGHREAAHSEGGRPAEAEAEASAARSAAAARPAPAPRPALALRALRPPLPARVRAPRGAPEHLRSALANGAVLRAAGPWRTSGAWWSEEERFAFEHYDVSTEDGWLLRLRLDRLTHRWQIDGIYD